jgi:hypothetical protein
LRCLKEINGHKPICGAKFVVSGLSGETKQLTKNDMTSSKQSAIVTFLNRDDLSSDIQTAARAEHKALLAVANAARALLEVAKIDGDFETREVLEAALAAL